MLLRSVTKGMLLILTYVHVVNFPFMSSDIPVNPTYGVYSSQLIRISRICDMFQSCHKAYIGRLLTKILIKQILVQ